MTRHVFLLIFPLWLSPLSAEISRGPYLQLTHETGVTIVWRSEKPMSNPRVGYSPVGTNDARYSEKEAILKRSESSDQKLFNAPDGTVQYEAQITGLKTSTTFQYTIFDGDQRLTPGDPDFHFTTHPPTGQATPTRVWVVGDSGTGQAHQILVHQAMQRVTAEEKRPIDLFLHVGDMAYGQGTDDQFQQKFFKPYQKTLRNTVCWGSLGNHEGKTSNGETGVGPFFDAYVSPTKGEAGGVPSGSESFYSFNYGDIHLLELLRHRPQTRRRNGKMACP